MSSAPFLPSGCSLGQLPRVDVSEVAVAGFSQRAPPCLPLRPSAARQSLPPPGPWAHEGPPPRPPLLPWWKHRLPGASTKPWHAGEGGRSVDVCGKQEAKSALTGTLVLPTWQNEVSQLELSVLSDAFSGIMKLVCCLQFLPCWPCAFRGWDP